MDKSKKLVPLKQYAVATLRKTVTSGDVCEEISTKVFLTPGAVLDCHLKSYIEDGYRVFSVYLCDKEDYINERIAYTLEDLQDTEETEKHMKDEFKSGKMNLSTYMDTLQMLQEFRLTSLKILYRQMHRLWRDDLDCHHELAVELYNHWFA